MGRPTPAAAPWPARGLGGPLRDDIDASLQLGGQACRQTFCTGGPSHPSDVLKNVAEILRGQRKHCGGLVQPVAELGNLPGGQRSNFTDGLGQQQVRVGRLQHLLVYFIYFLAFAEILGDGAADFPAAEVSAVEDTAYHHRLVPGSGRIITLGGDAVEPVLHPQGVDYLGGPRL